MRALKKHEERLHIEQLINQVYHYYSFVTIVVQLL